jgi:hypothetical protein
MLVNINNCRELAPDLHLEHIPKVCDDALIGTSLFGACAPTELAVAHLTGYHIRRGRLAPDRALPGNPP